ncbi:MAG: TonB-dependent receptor plug domain-containing protein, partial [Muribaculaceae bacterium]|nr:TonB-dependent receptor plug domain-containing protein [Muribaculaceae bacterium]
MQKALSLLFCLMCTVCSWAITVKGVVSDEAGEPIIGATVVEVGNAKNGTATDVNGAFAINVPPSASLQVSYVGYITKIVKLAGQSNITVTLEENAKALDEVVVVAFGKMKKEAFTGSAGVMNADELGKVQVTNAAQALAGRVAGVQINNASGQAGATPTITIRGIGSISSSTEPLIVVDGMPFDGDLSLINPNDIESMTVLKDAASNALYGARGANGVIMITTKRGNTGEARVSFDAKWGVNTNGLQKYQKMNSQQFYENFYRTLYNYYITDDYATRRNDGVKLSADEAHQLANYNLMNTATTGIGPGYMVYTVPQGQDFIQKGGVMNPKATLGAFYDYQGTKLWLQPDDWYKEG